MPFAELQDLLLFSIPVGLSMTTLATMHWYPWNKGTRPLKRVAAYTMGTVVVVGYPVATMFVANALKMSHGEVFWALLLIANVVLSGITVNVAYWIDGNRAVSLEETNDDVRG